MSGTNKGQLLGKVVNQDGNFYTYKNQLHESSHMYELIACSPREKETEKTKKLKRQTN